MSKKEYTIETEREDDGRWLAEVVDLSGVLAYGATEKEAVAAAHALALRVRGLSLSFEERSLRNEESRLDAKIRFVIPNPVRAGRGKRAA